jgi:glycine dehydrogenase subunit 2
VKEAAENPNLVKQSPHTTPIGRLDEVKAARQPKLRWMAVTQPV